MIKRTIERAAHSVAIVAYVLTNRFIHVDDFLCIFGVSATVPMICTMSSRHARAIQIGRNYSAHMHLELDATAIGSDREWNFIRRSKGNRSIK
jgi:hypothetical protein